ncbi:homocysteine S-methyltransferase [Zhihengliuella sp.]|uniref:homocysteine S-methyltransferase n=1 Tax=Zhihengliuella sp. TaxID=1954483 RepID=UPI002811A642|nr:homocysteine S-methyltransferase [Zhihengliuella sp.]
MPRSTRLSRLLAAGEDLVVDGALATELERHGCDLADPLWSAKVLLEQPHLIERVHREYFEAGARIAITASYQATPQGFAQRGIDQATALELVASSVHLADAARTAYAQAHAGSAELVVAGSVGPYGAYLADGSEYRGDYRLGRAAFEDFHRPRVEALVAAGADCLACETLPSAAEAEALLELVAEYDVEAWFSFTLRDGGHLSDGTSLDEVAARCAVEPRVAAIGVNCVPLELVTPALTTLGAASDLPLIAYPNSGEAYDPTTKTWSPAPATTSAGAELSGPADGVAEWRALGARLIGGCCRTTPRDIAAVGTAIHAG